MRETQEVVLHQELHEMLVGLQRCTLNLKHFKQNGTSLNRHGAEMLQKRPSKTFKDRQMERN